jgi:transcriptional regulator with XRE-family HTH domain
MAHDDWHAPVAEAGAELRYFFWQDGTMAEATRPDTSAVGAQASKRRLARFSKALRQAMVVNQISERKMALMLGITSGTTQKYFRGEVDPFKVGTGVNRGLAHLLGVTLDQLCDFYESGSYSKEVTAGISFEDVVSWMQSPAGADHIGPILETAARVCQQGPIAPLQQERLVQLAPFTWPMEELEAAGVSTALRERMGLTADALQALVEEGIFDDDLVEAFSVATNLDPVEVRKAFTNRLAIPPGDARDSIGV